MGRRAFLIIVFLAGALVAASEAAAPARLTRGDLRWLSRVTFGIDSATDRRAISSSAAPEFLDEQLHPAAADPAALAAAIAALPISQADRRRAREGQPRRAAAHQRPAERRRRSSKARMALNQVERPGRVRDGEAPPDARARVAVAAARADDLVLDEPLQRVLGQGQRPLDARGVRGTASARTRSASSAISCSRRRRRRRCSSISTTRRARAGRINENYARELMELHTLGVSGGRERIDATPSRTSRSWRAC